MPGSIQTAPTATVITATGATILTKTIIERITTAELIFTTVLMREVLTTAAIIIIKDLLFITVKVIATKTRRAKKDLICSN